MKKSILIILGALILMIAVGGFIFIKCHNDKEGEDDLSSADKDIIVVTEAYPTTFVIYGDDIEFDEKSIERSYRKLPRRVFTILTAIHI